MERAKRLFDRYDEGEMAAEVLITMLSAIRAADAALKVRSGAGGAISADDVLELVLGMFARLPYNPFWQRHGAMLMGAMSGAVLARLDSYEISRESDPASMKAFLAQHYQALGVASQVAALVGMSAGDMRKLREAVLEVVGHENGNS